MHPKPPIPADEGERLAALRRYRILDTGPEPQFDRLSELARKVFDVPIALVAFMDSDRNFFKASGDLPQREAPRDVSFCAYTILDDRVLVIPDTRADSRSAENPIVTDDPKLRFYAGAPINTRSGHRIGTVCLFDMKPRQLTPMQRECLGALAAIAADHIEMRRVVGDVREEIVNRRKAEAEARHLARHDALTGLPNRTALDEYLGRPAHSRGRATRYALYADLDSFKQANGLLGHREADRVLVRTARMMEKVLNDRGFLARISGDEFVAFVDDRSDAEVDNIANEIVRRLAKPMVLGSRLVATGISIGVANAFDEEESADALLQRADYALLAAKRQGGGRVAWYDHSMASNDKRRKQLAFDLRQAIVSETIDVHYQTIHASEDRKVVGVEALARWNHPSEGSIPPDEFVPLAEETGQIMELGDLVLRRALSDLKRWPEIFGAVNLSPLQFRQPDLSDRLLARIAEAGISPGRVHFEVTESTLIQDSETARSHIADLQQNGVRIALDDFGTGYSSLRYLRTIPFDKLKIDRSFVDGVEDSHENMTIVQHIVQLAHQLNMRVTAEGVETEYQEVLLRAAGVNSFQGYRFGRPRPAGEITAVIARNSRAA